MKVILASEHISKKLSQVSKAVSSKTQLPVLLHFLLNTKKNGIEISATDLEIGITVFVPAVIEEEGSCTVPAKLFSELIGTFAHEKITIQTSDTSVVITTKKTKSTLQTIDASEFPKLFEEKGEEIALFEKQEFFSDISHVVFSASMDISRPALSGILCKQEEQAFLMVATDGYRLSLIKTKGSALRSFPFEKGILIPARILKEVISIKEEGQVRMFVSQQNNQVLFESESTTVIGRMIEAEFPPFEKIIPSDFASQITVDKNEFLQAVKTTLIFAKDASNIIRFALKKNAIEISASTTSLGENSVEVEAVLTGEENEIAFNGRFVMDALSNIDSQDIVFEMTGPLNPGAFKRKDDSSFLHIIMPIRLKPGE